MMNSVLALNLTFLDQAITLIRERLGDHYALPCEEIFSSSIGQHFRHCVEHYEEFFRAVEEGGTIDYERRPREVILEIDPEQAIRRLEWIRGKLVSFPKNCRTLRVRDTGIDGSCVSSVSRELQFLVSHTVHHFALISAIATLSGIPVPENFGVAPSTLKYRNSV